MKRQMERTMELDIRTYDSEVRVRPNPKAGSIGTLVGYGAVFNSRSHDLGGFEEEVAPTAFNRALAEEQDVRGLVDHDPSRILGRTVAGTMRLEKDETGLRYEIDVPDTSAGRDIMSSVQRGDVTGSSFSFEVVSDEWRTEDGKEVRTLRDVNLYDVGPVSYPAYPATTSEASKRTARSRTADARRWARLDSIKARM